MVFLDMGRDGMSDTITLFVYFEKGDTASGNQGLTTAAAKKKPSAADSASVNNAQLKNSCRSYLCSRLW